MKDLICLISLSTLLTWAFTDIYFYSIVFDPIREWGKRLAKNSEHRKKKRRLPYYFGYALDCPFCMSHWFAAAAVILVWLDFYCVSQNPPNMTVLTLFIVILIDARMVNLLRDHMLPPITNEIWSENNAENNIENKPENNTETDTVSRPTDLRGNELGSELGERDSTTV
jgi:hypothetical protein